MSNEESLIIMPDTVTNEKAAPGSKPGLTPDLPEGIALAWVPDPRERFEYRMAMVSGRADTQESRLNELGTEGWELIGLSGSTAIMKRKMVSIPVRVDSDGNVLGPAFGPQQENDA